MSAAEAAQAMAAGARRAGWEVDLAPVSDGGEGFAAALGGLARPQKVHDPLGRIVQSCYFELEGPRVVAVEMALASGLELVGGPQANDPVAASTAGTGELIAAAVRSGAKSVLVGVGGSATTDGGLGALQAMEPLSRLSGVRLVVACDVRTKFLQAARCFAAQKGATPAQVRFLARRLESLADLYRRRFGVDVSALVGGGAAGGLAGGLAAVGAELVSGFEVVADRLGLGERVAGADLVISGEGLLDEQSWQGKSVGGVVGLAEEASVPAAVIAGAVESPPERQVEVVSLVESFGPTLAWSDPKGCLQEATYRLIRRL